MSAESEGEHLKVKQGSFAYASRWHAAERRLDRVELGFLVNKGVNSTLKAEGRDRPENSREIHVTPICMVTANP